MSAKEITVFLLGLGLVGIITFLKNSNNIFQANDTTPVVIGITKPQESTDDITSPPALTFPTLNSIEDIPAFEYSEVENQQDNLNAIVESLKSAMNEEKFFTPKEDNALVYLLQLKSFDLSEESLLNMINDNENKLIDHLLNNFQKGFQESEESILTESISRLKTLNVKNTRINELKTQLRDIKNLNKLAAKAEKMINEGNVSSTTEESAYQVALQIKDSKIENLKTSSIYEKISKLLLEEANQATAQSYFKIAQRNLNKALNLTPSLISINTTLENINAKKQQRFRFLNSQFDSSVKVTNIIEAQKILSQITDLELAGVSEKKYQDQISRMKIFGSFSPFDEFIPQNNNELPKMIVMNTGKFLMGKENGSNYEQPVHEVQINYGFAVSKNEITVEQFGRFIKASGYKTTAEKGKSSRIYDIRTGRMRVKSRTNWRHNFIGKRAKNNEPVIHVSWQDTQAYINWLNQKYNMKFRLLSEAEFEYVLRAGNTYKYPWGDGTPTEIIENITGKNDRAKNKSPIKWTDGFENYNDGHWGPAPVGSFKSNPFRLNDIAGNVMEWVDDCWHDSYTRAPRNGSSWANPGCESHVVRGGSWSSAPYEFEASHRFKADSDFSDPRLGFRIAINISTSSYKN